MLQKQKYELEEMSVGDTVSNKLLSPEEIYKQTRVVAWLLNRPVQT